MFPRVSPRGDRVAFADRGVVVSVVDLKGNVTALSSRYGQIGGIAWSPSGDEVWFSAGETPANKVLRVVTVSGRERVVYRAPGNLFLEDVSPQGQALVKHGAHRSGIAAGTASERAERDLSLFERCYPSALSADGRSVLVGVQDEAGGRQGSAYLRRIDGSPAIRLGEGLPQDLTPDGRWALVLLRDPGPRLVALPTGPGEVRPVALGMIEPSTGVWFPDGKRVVVQGRE